MRRLIVLLFVVFAVSAFTSGSFAAGPDGEVWKREIKGCEQDLERHPAPQAVNSILEESVGDAWAEVCRTNNKSLGNVRGRFRVDKRKPMEEAALDFIDRHRDAFGLKEPRSELAVKRKNAFDDGTFAVHYSQVHDGVPVWNSGYSAFFYEDGDLSGLGGSLVPSADLEGVRTEPRISREEAEDTLRDIVKIPGDTTWPHEVRLVLMRVETSEFMLLYEMRYYQDVYFLDALDGSIHTEEELIGE